MHSIHLNGKTYELDVPGEMPVLWAVRDVLGFTGTKFGCGIGQCGTCTMHMNGQPIRACIITVAATQGQQLTSIEGIADDPVGAKVQEAWVEEGVPQCGFCQCGQVMSATALLQSNPQPDDTEVESAMVGNICRCGTYNRIKTAIQTASSKIKEASA